MVLLFCTVGMRRRFRDFAIGVVSGVVIGFLAHRLVHRSSPTNVTSPPGKKWLGVSMRVVVVLGHSNSSESALAMAALAVGCSDVVCVGASKDVPAVVRFDDGSSFRRSLPGCATLIGLSHRRVAVDIDTPEFDERLFESLSHCRCDKSADHSICFVWSPAGDFQVPVEWECSVHRLAALISCRETDPLVIALACHRAASVLGAPPTTAVVASTIQSLSTVDHALPVSSSPFSASPSVRSDDPLMTRARHRRAGSLPLPPEALSPDSRLLSYGAVADF